MAMIDFDQTVGRRKIPRDPFTQNVINSTAPAQTTPTYPTNTGSGGGPGAPPSESVPPNPYKPPPTTPSTNPNTGVSGHADPTTPPPPVVPTAPAPRPGQAPAGVDPGKWAAGHTSPKYAFMEVSQKYDQRTDQGRQQTLAELQQRFPQWFTGWVIDRDKLRHGSGQLHADFDGYNEFDAWGASGAGVWRPQWMPTQRNGVAYVDPQTAAQQQAGATGGAPTGATNGAGGGVPAGTPTGNPLPGGFDPFGPDGMQGLGEFQFDDPDTVRLLEFVNKRIQELTAGVEDPTVDRALEAIYGRADQLNNPMAKTAEAARLEQMIADALAKLDGPAFSDSESAMYRTKALDGLERDRQGEIRATVRRMEAMGHAPSSGTIQQAINDINTRYEQQRTEIARDLALFGIDETNRRRTEGLGIATQGRDLAAQEQATNEGRMNQALQLILGAPEITRQARGEQQGNMDKALTLMSLPIDLTDARMQRVMEVLGLGGGSNPMGMFNSLAGLASQNAAQRSNDQQANSQFWAQIGQMMATANAGSGK